MKLKAIQTYQSVKFQGKQDNFFSAAIPAMAGLTMTYKDGMVRLETAKDCVVIFTANIAYAVPADAEQAPAELQKRGTMRDVDHNRPPKT
jgi:hypothetical protein